MSNTVIQLKKSSTPSATPGSLANGELAINYADGIIYYKAANGVISSISSGTPSFGTINANGTLLIADVVNDYLTINPGNNIEITGDAINDSLIITANQKSVFDVANAAFNTANAAGGDLTPANNWANTKLSNTSGVTFNGNLIIGHDLFITNNITNVTSLMFNTSTNRTPTTAGELTWSQDDSTLRFNMDTVGSVVGHIGQDLFYLAKNQTGSSIPKGTVVRFAGTLGASGRLLIAPAIANNSYPSKYVMGVTASAINNGDDGYVIAQGKIRGIDTSMFSAGDILYVSSSTAGGFSNTMPSAPNNKITVAAVINSDNIQGSIEVRVTLGSKINEDELAELGTLSEGDILYYVSANGRFENKQSLASINAWANTVAFTSANNANIYGMTYTNTSTTGANNFAGLLANNSNNWGNTINTAVQTSFAAVNNYTVSVGTAANSYAGSMANSVNSNMVSANNFAGLLANNSNNRANTVNTAVQTSFAAVNNYTIFVGASSNNWSNTVNTAVQTSFAAVNNYTIFVGASGNNWSNTVNTAVQTSFAAVNNYTISVGTAANSYAGSMANSVNSNMVSANNFAGLLANNANNWANTKLANTSGVSFAGSITFPLSVTFSGANMYVDDGNNFFGIGTTWPNTSLDVRGTANVLSGLNIGSINVAPSLTAGNNYATSIGASSNNWANTVNTAVQTSFAAVNNYTVSVGTAGNTNIRSANNFAGVLANNSNNWANTVNTAVQTSFAAVNNYTVSVGTAANNYAISSFYTIANGTAAFAKANSGISNSTTTLITAGYTVGSYSIGTPAASSTLTPDPSLGNYQFLTNNAAFTLAVPGSNCAIDILVTNGASAGTITISASYTAPSGGGGDTYATTNGNKYLLMIRRINGVSTYAWKALQ